jgi:DNA-binding NtrC family response regulator
MHLPADLFCEADEAGDEQQFSQAVRHWINRQWDRGITYDRLHNALERVLLGQLLARYDNKPTVMANDLNINRATLLKKRRRMELD